MNQSPWLFLDAADIMLKAARRRCYITTDTFRAGTVVPLPADDDDEAWAVLDAELGTVADDNGREKWLPDGMEPVLEELPKWPLLVEVMQEIEQTMIDHPLPPRALRLCASCPR